MKIDSVEWIEHCGSTSVALPLVRGSMSVALVLVRGSTSVVLALVRARGTRHKTQERAECRAIVEPTWVLVSTC